jgi:hypothetical protein
MKTLTPNEMAVERYRIATKLIELGESILDPNEDFRNVCDAMDALSYYLDVLDDIRHSAFPEWFSEKPSNTEENV